MRQPATAHELGWVSRGARPEPRRSFEALRPDLANWPGRRPAIEPEGEVNGAKR